MDRVMGMAERLVNKGGKNSREPIMKGRWLGRGQLNPMQAIYGCPPDEGKCAKHPWVPIQISRIGHSQSQIMQVKEP